VPDDRPRLIDQPAAVLQHAEEHLEVAAAVGWLPLAHIFKRHLADFGRKHGLDPAQQMHTLARKRMRNSGIDAQLLTLSAEDIPVADASFDTLVMTYTLCSIQEPVKAVKEMRRVLKPGGRLLFCEHGLAPEAPVRRWQVRLTPFWKPLAGGCHLDRDIPRILQEGGWHIAELETAYLPGPKPLTFNYWGTAVAPSCAGASECEEAMQKK